MDAAARTAARARRSRVGRAHVVAAAASAVILASTLYLVARATPMFAVRAIQVRGAAPELAERVRAQLSPVLGTTLLALDGDEVVDRATAVPEVASVTYDRAFPNTLVVRVTSELPVAVVRRGSAGWIVSARGRVLAPVVPAAAPPLPRVWVSRAVTLTRGARVADGRTRALVAAATPLARRRRFPDRVRTVDEVDGELRYRLASGLELRLGSAHDLPLKLAVAARILPALERDGFGYLDVSSVARPVAGSADPRLSGRAG